MILLILKIIFTIIWLMPMAAFGLMFTVGSLYAHRNQPDPIALIFFQIFGVAAWIGCAILACGVWNFPPGE